jgi:hypothetical protein
VSIDQRSAPRPLGTQSRRLDGGTRWRDSALGWQRGRRHIPVLADAGAELDRQFVTVTIRGVHRPRGRLRGGMMISALGWHGDLQGLRRRVGRIGAGLAIVSVVASVLTGFVAPAHAEPASGDPAATPYPELRYFTEIDAAPYAVGDTPAADFPDQPGVWFVTAQGLSCGIWFRGSFGCTGDIPGAPAGITRIGWITGDTRVHYDWTLAIRFPPTSSQGLMTIPPLTYITSEGTTCATTLDGSTYCERGPFRFMITSTHTWLNG